MYSYRVPLAAPYWNGTTYRQIFRSIRSGSVIDGPDLEDLRSKVMETVDVREAVLCGSGSLALEIALRACEVRPGDEVVIPSFCCTAVVSPISAVGAIPVLADVGEDLNLTAETVGVVLTQKTKAVIVPHLFGNPAGIGAIVELAHDNSVCVIDDAAQALGATIDGRPVGSFGDAGILSFGSEKVCFGIGGGIVVSRQEGKLRGAGMLESAKPLLKPPLQRLFATMLRRRRGGWARPVQRVLSRKRSEDPRTPPAAYRQERMVNLAAAIACSLMHTLDQNIAARRARVRAYQGLLSAVEGLQLISHSIGSACLTQVVRVLPKRNGRDLAINLIEALGRGGYEIRGSYVPIHLLGNFDNCVWDRLPHTQRVWADLIELPCEPEVNLTDVERIAGIVRKIVASA